MTQYSSHAAPIRIDADLQRETLRRMRLGKSDNDGGRREDFLQEFVHQHPEVLPLAAIEGRLQGLKLVPVCRELRIRQDVGREEIYLDNLWLTVHGDIVLGECKLIKNPQSRREVLAQAIDYAASMQDWNFDRLQQAVRDTLGNQDMQLWDLVKQGAGDGQEDGSADDFVEAIERNLRHGHLVILIIADEIGDGLNSLKRYLDLHAGFHATIALVELSLWEDGEGTLLVVPRVPMKTVLVERGIVRVSPEGAIRVVAPARATEGAEASLPKPVTLSEEQFYEALERDCPGTSSRLRQFLDGIEDAGIEPIFRRSASLRWSPGEDLQASAGYIETNGAVHVGITHYWAKKYGCEPAGRAYLERLASLIGGSVYWVKDGETADGIRRADKKLVRIADLLDHAEEWKAAIKSLVEAVKPPRETDE